VSPRRIVLLGALLTVLGLAVAATAPIVGTGGAEHARTQQVIGGVVLLLGWAALAWGVHRFGRAKED
jgi:hypothetical protein